MPKDVRIICIFIVLALVSGGFTGCRKKEAPLIPEDADPTGMGVSFLYPFTRAPEDAFLELVGRFNDTNPWNIQVNSEYAGTWEDLYAYLAEGASCGSLPDAAIMSPVEGVRFGETGYAKDLEPYIESEEWGFGGEPDALLTEFIEAHRELAVSGGLYSLPFSQSAYVLYYNRELLVRSGFKNPPDTWEEFRNIAGGLHDKGESSVPLAYYSSPEILETIGLGFGGDNGRSGVYHFSGKDMKEALSLIREFHSMDFVKPFLDPWDSQSAFCDSGAVFAIDSSEALVNYDRTICSVKGGMDWGAVPVPASKAGGDVLCEGISWVIFPSNASRELAVWLFISWLTEPEQQVFWSESTLSLPCSEEAWGLLLANPDLSKPYLELLATSRERRKCIRGSSRLSWQSEETVCRMLDEAVSTGDIDSAVRIIEDLMEGM